MHGRLDWHTLTSFVLGGSSEAIYRYNPSLWFVAQRGSRKKALLSLSTFIYIQSYFSIHFWTTAAGAPTVTGYNIDRLHIMADGGVFAWMEPTDHFLLSLGGGEWPTSSGATGCPSTPIEPLKAMWTQTMQISQIIYSPPTSGTKLQGNIFIWLRRWPFKLPMAWNF